MSSGAVVPTLPSPIAATQTALVAVSSSAARLQFETLVTLQWTLTHEKKEAAASLFAAEQIKTQLGNLTTANLSADAVTRLSAAIEAEEKRRRDAKEARKTLSAGVDRLIKAYEVDYPREALAVWEGYLKGIKAYNDEMKALDKEVKRVQTKINQLRREAKKKTV